MATLELNEQELALIEKKRAEEEKKLLARKKAEIDRVKIQEEKFKNKIKHQNEFSEKCFRELSEHSDRYKLVKNHETQKVFQATVQGIEVYKSVIL